MHPKLSQLLWIAGMATAIVALQALATFDPTTITDYRAWVVGIAAQAIRAAAAVILAWLKSA